MKRGWLLILLCCGLLEARPQEKAGQEVLAGMKTLHQLMTRGDALVGQYVDDSLSYGHSNGWVENKMEFLSNLGNRLVYHAIMEDSVQVRVNRKVAHIRFTGTFDVSLQGKKDRFRLKVLEVWVKQRKTWKLFARQAVRAL
jgi:hypothetical protein